MQLHRNLWENESNNKLIKSSVLFVIACTVMCGHQNHSFLIPFLHAHLSFNLIDDTGFVCCQDWHICIRNHSVNKNHYFNMTHNFIHIYWKSLIWRAFRKYELTLSNSKHEHIVFVRSFAIPNDFEIHLWCLISKSIDNKTYKHTDGSRACTGNYIFSVFSFSYHKNTFGIKSHVVRGTIYLYILACEWIY